MRGGETTLYQIQEELMRSMNLRPPWYLTSTLKCTHRPSIFRKWQAVAHTASIESVLLAWFCSVTSLLVHFLQLNRTERNKVTLDPLQSEVHGQTFHSKSHIWKKNLMPRGALIKREKQTSARPHDTLFSTENQWRAKKKRSWFTVGIYISASTRGPHKIDS